MPNPSQPSTTYYRPQLKVPCLRSLRARATEGNNEEIFHDGAVQANDLVTQNVVVTTSDNDMAPPCQDSDSSISEINGDFYNVSSASSSRYSHKEEEEGIFEDSRSDSSVQSGLSQESSSSDDCPHNVRESTLEEIFAEFSAAKVKHNISDRGFDAMWNLLRKHVVTLCKDRSDLPCSKTLRRKLLRNLPTMSLDICHRNLENGELVYENQLSKFPKKKYGDTKRWEAIYEIWSVTVKAVLDFHRTIHAGEQCLKDIKEVIINCDGVPIGRSGLSQTITSLKFEKCSSVYTMLNAIGRKEKKLITSRKILLPLLSELRSRGFEVKYFVCDAPMRSFIRGQLGHGAKMACDYCLASAKTYMQRRVWGADTVSKPKRQMGQIHTLLQEKSQGVEGAQEKLRRYGYVDKSVILDVFPDFELILKVPVDPMHLLYLGMARAMVELTFNVGDKRPTKCHMALLNPDIMKNDLQRIRTPSEMTRKPRCINYKNFKCQEWRNYVQVYFPTFISHITDRRVKKIWLGFVFLCRAYSLDDDLFKKIREPALKSLTNKWYKLYIKTFGDVNMRYNTHMFLHLDCIRKMGPFHEISAFPFEASFADTTRAQVVGTSSIGKQAIIQTFSRLSVGHVCEKNIKITPAGTSRRDDSIIYVGNFRFVSVMTVDKESVHGYLIKRTEYRPLPDLSFDKVGVFEFLSVTEELVTVPLSDVRGKGILVYDEDKTIIISASKSFLLEAF